MPTIALKDSESQNSEVYNLKVTIGALKFVGRNETQISQAQCSEICKSNYPIAFGYWKQSRQCS